MIKVHIDGACSGNPGPAGIGVYILKSVSNYEWQPIYELSQSIGEATNNIAEWTALIEALKFLVFHQQQFANEEIVICSDSQLVVKQINGEWKTKDHELRLLKAEAKDLLRSFSNVRIEYIPRSKNAEADKLAKEAVKLAKNTKKER